MQIEINFNFFILKKKYTILIFKVINFLICGVNNNLYVISVIQL